MADARVCDGWLVTSDGRISHFKEKEMYVGANWLSRGSLPRVTEKLVDMLEDIRVGSRHSIFITSGVRSKAANDAADGSAISDHLSGGAADFHSPGMTPWDFVGILNTVTAFGSLGRFGIYHRLEGGHCHIDINQTSPLRRFLVIRGQYIDLVDWVKAHFPVMDMQHVPRDEANALLGF